MGTFGSMPSLSRLGSIVCVYMLVAPGFSQAQPATGRTDGNPPVARLGRFSTGEPALSRGADPASAELETWQASWKAFDPKTTKILTAEQKLIWETRKLEIKTEQANRATNPQATELSNGQRPSTLGRIQSLEEEVKLLKGEVEKLKATIRAVKPEAR